MNAPLTRITAGHIDPALIDDIIARAVALRAKPSRFGVEMLNFACALDVVLGNDVMTDTISDLESDLGFSETECLSCGQGSCGCDQAHDDRSSWGMTAFRTPDGGYGVAA